MAQDGVIELTKLRDNIVRFTKSAVAPEIATLVAQRNSIDEDRMKIIDALSEYSLLGNDGLKGRTSLLEHRYDKI